MHLRRSLASRALVVWLTSVPHAQELPAAASPEWVARQVGARDTGRDSQLEMIMRFPTGRAASASARSS